MYGRRYPRGMARFFAFVLGLVLVAHYVALGMGDLGGGDLGKQWRDACMGFFADVGFDEEWQVRMTRGAPAVFVGTLMALWSVWPRKKKD